MATLSDVHRQQTSLEASLHQRMSEFEEQLKRSSEPSSLSRLYEDYRAFKENVCGILQMLRTQINELSRATDVLEMRHRRKCLLFGGIAEVPKEDSSSLICRVLEDQLHIKDVVPASFKACHRLGSGTGGRPRPILVRFADHSVKTAVWKKKSALKGTTTVISGFLTRRRQDLFLEARKRFGITNCWSLDGNIYAKLPDGKRRHITCEDDLEFSKQAVPAEPQRDSPVIEKSTAAGSSTSQRSKRAGKSK
ncbi:hypothetical protein ABMA28_013121 [Loxostege sticticalis]|uniref:Zinc finger DNA binding protein n=1 Tax=Loxostege sticticalis TaxID=481309 RepID=A0ABD0S3M9_LOXSC